MFIIVAEILTAKVKQNSIIKGIQVPDTDLDNPEIMDILITQFADDTTIVADSVNEVMKEVFKKMPIMPVPKLTGKNRNS